VWAYTLPALDTGTKMGVGATQSTAGQVSFSGFFAGSPF
jgi:hypothetical protein